VEQLVSDTSRTIGIAQRLFLPSYPDDLFTLCVPPAMRGATKCLAVKLCFAINDPNVSLFLFSVLKFLLDKFHQSSLANVISSCTNGFWQTFVFFNAWIYYERNTTRLPSSDRVLNIKRS